MGNWLRDATDCMATTRWLRGQLTAWSRRGGCVGNWLRDATDCMATTRWLRGASDYDEVAAWATDCMATTRWLRGQLAAWCNRLHGHDEVAAWCN